MTEKLSFDAMGIEKLIPHRYPFLLVDGMGEDDIKYKINL